MIVEFKSWIVSYCDININMIILSTNKKGKVMV